MDCDQLSNTTHLIEVMNHFQTEDDYVFLVLEASQVSMYPDIDTDPPICSSLCHLQVQLQHQLQPAAQVVMFTVYLEAVRPQLRHTVSSMRAHQLTADKVLIC